MDFKGLLPILSNIAYLIPLIFYKKSPYPFLYAILWSIVAIISTLYHICDEYYCIAIPFRSWHFIDVYMGYTVGSFTLLTVFCDEAIVLKRFCSKERDGILVVRMYYFVGIVIWGLFLHFDPTNVYAFCIYGAGIVLILLLSIPFPSKTIYWRKLWPSLICSGVAIAGFILSLQAETQSSDSNASAEPINHCGGSSSAKGNSGNYWIFHSLWHIFGALGFWRLLYCREWDNTLLP